MTDYNTLRSVVSEIRDEHISLEERDRLAENEELIHLCKAYEEIKYAAHTSDSQDVWDKLEAVEQVIIDRLEAINQQEAQNE